jgi:hypothetical protein
MVTGAKPGGDGLLISPVPSKRQVNNPAGLVQLENDTLLMGYEATVTHGGGTGQGTAVIASDSGSWRGPWRLVTPGLMPVGWPNVSGCP